jgi:uncharacterized protein (TIGR02271 family)
MHIFSSDGEKLGKLSHLEDRGFTIEKGLFFKDNYFEPYDAITDIRQDSVVLSISKTQLETGGGFQPGMSGATRGYGTSTESRVPLAEEELTATKTMHQAGGVHVHKDVVTEQRQINVPVTREEVHVERTPVGTPAKPGEARFERQDINIPVTEEEVEIHKRPVVREEVRVSKTQHQEQRTASGSIRKETAEIEDERKRSDRDRDLRGDLDLDKDKDRKL